MTGRAGIPTVPFSALHDAPPTPARGLDVDVQGRVAGRVAEAPRYKKWARQRKAESRNATWEGYLGEIRGLPLSSTHRDAIDSKMRQSGVKAAVGKTADTQRKMFMKMHMEGPVGQGLATVKSRLKRRRVPKRKKKQPSKPPTATPRPKARPTTMDQKHFIV